jgi:Domain of unknown function (DUF4430)
MNHPPLPFAMRLILCLIVAIFGCRGERSTVPSPLDSGKPVDVQIDFNGQAPNKQFHIDWSPKLTAFGCLEQLQARGKLHVASRGIGDQTLLTAIDGLENLWAAGDNWIYYVNDQLGDRSSAVSELQPGDRVVWRFGKYAPK